MRLKSILAALLLMVAGLQTVWAQKMVIYKADKTTIELGALDVDSIVFVEAELAPTICPDGNHPHAIDLGLPSGTKWCCCNVGASTPEGYGGYYAWGEISEKSVYTWSTYAYFDPDSETGFVNIGSEIAGTGYDAATVNMGASWRMPSHNQLVELIDNCSSQWTQQNGVNGILVTGPNEGQIFLPAAGSRYEDFLDGAGDYSYYWSGSLDQSGYNASIMYFDSSDWYWNYYYSRCNGQSVRAVCGGAKLVTAIALSNEEISLQVNETKTLTATIEPSDADNPAVEWKSSNEAVATVSDEGLVTAVAEGTCAITCSATDGSGVKAECQVMVKAKVPDTHEYVDLGLPSGTLWATCNVGANSPEEFGDYFAWGETEPKEEYDWNTYKWCNGSYDTMTKYCTDSNYGYNGFTDNKTELEASDDAATANWGNDWQMPSRVQMQELYNSNYTTTEWTTQNGVSGRKITSKSNGNSIFLPAAGSYNGVNLFTTGIFGSYWSRSIGDSVGAYELNVGSDGIYYNVSFGRNYGISVRPVRVQNTPPAKLVTAIALSDEALSLQVNETKTLTATVEPTDADNPAVTWESSNEAVATVSDEGLVTAVAEGTCTITCSATDGSGVKAECVVTVTKAGGSGGPTYLTCPDDHHPHAIDLGLPSGTKWCCCNVGASIPEGYGGYYAWGETSTKSVYNDVTYKYFNGQDTNGDGWIDQNFSVVNIGSDIAGTGYDAATVNMGAPWRMPSTTQQQELINNCSRQWTQQNGINGILVTGRNGGQIFLPAAGLRRDDELRYAGGYGYYWSSSLHPDDIYAYGMSFGSSDWNWGGNGYRYGGRSVRAVRP